MQSPPVWGCVLLPPPSQPLSFLGVQLARLLRSAVCPFWGADLWLGPSQQMSVIQNPTKRSLLAVWYMMPLWGRDCPLPALDALSCLSLVEDGPVRSRLALFSPLFCEQAWWCLRLGFFVESRHSYPTVWVAISS